jgi:hypothetical protein
MASRPVRNATLTGKIFIIQTLKTSRHLADHTAFADPNFVADFWPTVLLTVPLSVKGHWLENYTVRPINNDPAHGSIAPHLYVLPLDLYFHRRKELG